MSQQEYQEKIRQLLQVKKEILDSIEKFSDVEQQLSAAAIKSLFDFRFQLTNIIYKESVAPSDIIGVISTLSLWVFKDAVHLAAEQLSAEDCIHFHACFIQDVCEALNETGVCDAIIKEGDSSSNAVH